MKRENESYLGDGLFASWDGYQILLRAPRDNGDHLVFLDPMVLESFFNFLEQRLNVKVTMEKADPPSGAV